MAQIWNPSQGNVPDNNSKGKISSQIHLSRDQTRDQIIEYLQSYLELENVDLTKSSFLSFMVDILSTLTSNMLFYQTSVYREFFLTQAQLPESILNLAAFLGYKPSNATHASVNVLVTIPFGFSDPTATFSFPEAFQFKADDVIFETSYTTTIVVNNNSSVDIKVNDNGRIFNLPVDVDTTANNDFSFVLPINQYKTTIQEFQLDQDLQIYQFSQLDVEFDGKISDIAIYVKDPGSNPDDTGRLYTEFDSLYLMSASDYGFVSRKTAKGRTVYFGNGLMGAQPLAGSTIVIYIIETQGADGNVISASITEGDRVYTVQGGVTQIVSYTCINTSPATGGEDEEELQEVRSNAIAHLTSLNRLVTEGDYQNIGVIVPDTPLSQNSTPVLKRSDLKVNEIQIFTNLDFNGEVVPLRNATHSIPVATTYIPRETVISIDADDYYTIFDMTVDTMNSAAMYHYIMREIDQVPVLVQAYGSNPYDIYINQLNVENIGETAVFTLTYYSEESDFNLVECQLKIPSTGEVFSMTNTPGANGGTFTFTFNPYTLLPDGSVEYLFVLSNPGGLLSEYNTTLVFRQELRDIMLSNTVIDGTANIIYDIPVVQKEYYDGIVQKDFELEVLQKLLTSMELVEYRMLTDFTNLKFSNSTGKIINMLRNTTTKRNVIDMGLTSVPTSPALNDDYIVTGYEGGEWATHRDDIAVCIDATAVTWSYITPTSDDMVYVVNKDQLYIYTDKGWVVPIYDIPLQIELEVFKTRDVTVQDSYIESEIKSTLLTAFEGRFGGNMELYKSEIIDIVQNIEGVGHCRVVKPESNIFFNFDLKDFTQQELLDYTPEYIYFTEDNIIIRLLEQ
ncbi:DUF2793 domain-containing protein [Candidatus Pacearchaeota archaeon]|nr:DUF2793 domain-containing protein [Candidatus Pacearchaeota archaeon]